MKVTIVTFDDSIGHLPIAVYGSHQEALHYLRENYSWSNLVLNVEPVLNYLAFVDSDDMPEDTPLARLNIVSLKGAMPTRHIDVIAIDNVAVLGNLSWDGNYYIDGDE